MTGRHDWKVNEMVPLLGITAVVCMAVSHVATLISNAASGPQEQITFAGSNVMGGMFSLYFVITMGWGHWGEWRSAWRLLCGTPVLCRREMLHQWHLNRHTDPVWQFLETIPSWQYHIKPHSRQVTFLYRKHAVLFKLAWG